MKNRARSLVLVSLLVTSAGQIQAMPFAGSAPRTSIATTEFLREVLIRARILKPAAKPAPKCGGTMDPNGCPPPTPKCGGTMDPNGNCKP